MLNIWRVEHLESDTEKASCVHSLSLESNPAKCCYSPDGKLVAVTCDSLFTYIVCSRSGVVLYTLAYVDEQPRPMPCISPTSFSVTLFAGRTCQVLTTPNHKNNSIAIWNLPVVYSLETLCLLAAKKNALCKKWVFTNDKIQKCFAFANIQVLINPAIQLMVWENI